MNKAALALLSIGVLPPPRRSAVDEVIVVDVDAPPRRSPLSSVAIGEVLESFTSRPESRPDFFSARAAKQERMTSDRWMARRAREKREYAKTRKAERQRRKSNRR